METRLQLNDYIVMPYIREGGYASRMPWSYGERRLLDYLLVYIEEGRCRFMVNGVVHHLNRGDFCLVQPGDLLTLEGLTPTRTPYLHLDFFYHPLREQSFPTSAGMVNLDNYTYLIQPRLNDFEGINVPTRFSPKQPALFINKMNRMIGCWLELTSLGSIEAQKIGTELFLDLVHYFEIKEERRDAAAGMLERITAYLSLHLNEVITVKQMAEQVHLSPSRFTTVFQNKYGVSPYQFLLKYRIERAMELLQTQPDLSVTQIAEYCGFKTVQHFSSSFRGMIGISPGRYLKHDQ